MQPNKHTMQYRYLGNTGIKVSIISLGNWLNSDSEKDRQNTIDCVRTAWQLGINFFDTAEIYGYGSAEVQMGEALRKLGVPRSDYVLSTKLLKATAELKPNRYSMSRKHLIEGMKKSLKNLGEQYVDLVFSHRPDRDTPMEEICRAFDWIIRKGYARYWGTSEWDADEIAQAKAICQRLGLYEPAFEQPQYNIFVRERFEIEYKRLFAKHKMGSTIWSPLLSGILTGKYNKALPEGSRFEKFQMLKSIYDRYFGENVKEATLKKLTQFTELASSLGITSAQLAMAWCLRNHDVSTAITGASHPDQLRDTVKAVDFLKQYTPEIDRKIQEIFQNEPTGKLNRKTFAPEVSRRVDREH